MKKQRIPSCNTFANDHPFRFIYQINLNIIVIVDDIPSGSDENRGGGQQKKTDVKNRLSRNKKACCTVLCQPDDQQVPETGETEKGVQQ